uniref:anthocyanidin 3-O-glucoside 5-O-glucosyltransferase n=1 Tax=Scoparia dulcis TaxID=107240 RepID=A0A5H2Q9Z4_SCODU|nr:UDP-glycosyltransferase [Scoparia dulcis]
MENTGEENNLKQQRGHCLILPYPIQGHINPMLQFSKRLLHKKIKITLVVPKQLARTMQFSSSSGILLETISDGFDDGIPPGTDPEDHRARFSELGPQTLKEALYRLASAGHPVDCIVYDPFLDWGLEVAKELGLKAAALFTQSCAVCHIYNKVFTGELKVPLSEDDISIPGLPPMKPGDMPSFVSVYGSYPSFFEMVVNQFRGLEKADWLFFNTFYKLEEEVMDYMAKFFPVKAIGPTIPSMYLDKRLPEDREYGLSIFKPKTAACMDWLNEREPRSVAYVSFGSLAQLGVEQMEELAWGLKLSGKHFLWVVRSSEESKLPKDFAQETSEKGLIVSWCPQLDVLAHEAIGCFITHCGWNSTLEASSLGVPMVAIPQWTDQSTNAKFVMDVWKMGIRAPVDQEKGVVTREAIDDCIKQVFEGGKGEDITKNATKWKELAKEAVDEGGNSDKNLEEFVTSLRSISSQIPCKEMEALILDPTSTRTTTNASSIP